MNFKKNDIKPPARANYRLGKVATSLPNEISQDLLMIKVV